MDGSSSNTNNNKKKRKKNMDVAAFFAFLCHALAKSVKFSTYRTEESAPCTDS